MEKKDILIVAPFADLPSENGNCRYFYLAELLSARNDVQVELVISSFSHLKKAARDTAWKPDRPYRLTYIQEPGYPKNVCLQRFRSHRVMGRNLAKYLETRGKPDVVFCAVPSLDAAKAAASFCEKNDVRFVVDVQDLWPEAFEMVVHIPPLSTLAFLPLRAQADYIYSRADDIVAVSRTYADRAARVNRKGGRREVVFLGTKLADFDRYRSTKPHDEAVCRIGYVGTLGHSYNISCILRALELLRQQGHTDYFFDVMGDGPLMAQFQREAEEKRLPVHFWGRLPYPQMVERLTACDIAVNPIMKGAAQSIINKVGDYAAAALPVVSTQECPEYQQLVDTWEIGYNCDGENIAQISEKLQRLRTDRELRLKMGANNRHLAEQRFDRETSYREILKLLVE